MKQIKQLLSIMSLALIANFAQAQVNIISTPPPPTSPLDVCGAPAHFQVKLQGIGPAAANSGQLTINMPTGINYKAGSAVYVSGASGSIAENASNPSAPILSVANIAVGSTVIIDFQAEADCRRINEPINSNQYVFSSSAATQTFSGGTASNPGYNVQYAAMNITTMTNASYIGVAGGSFTRTITVINGGFGSTPEVRLDATNTGGLQIQSVAVSGASSVVSSVVLPSGNTTYIVSGFTGNGLFDTNESITITETLLLPATSCGGAAGSSQSAFKAYYGCFGNSICPETNSTDISSSALAAVSWTGGTAGGAANLVASAPLANPPVCFSTAVPYTFTITNTSATDATNVVVSLDSRDKDIQYLSNFAIVGSPLSPVITSAPNAGVSACFSSAPATALNKGTLTIPSILAGQSVTITFEGQRCCNANYCRLAAAPIYGFSASVSFSDACNHSGSVASRTYAVPVLPEASTIINYFELKDFAIALDTAESGAYKVDLDFLVPAGDNTGYMEFRLPLQNHVLEYAGGPATLKQDALTWLPAAGYPVVINDTLVTRFAVADMPAGFSITTRQKHRLSIAVKGGSNNENTNFILGVKYIASASCANCALKLYCGPNEISLYVIKPSHIICGGRYDSKYVRVERFSYGKVDNNEDNIPDVLGVINQDTIRKYDIMLGDTIATDIQLVLRDTAAAAAAGFQYAYAYAKFDKGLVNMAPQMLNANFTVGSRNGQHFNLPNVPAFVVDNPAIAQRKFGFKMHDLLPAGHRFYNGDTITFHVRYRMAGQGNLGLVLIAPQLFITNDTTIASNRGGDCAGKKAFVYVHPVKTLATASIVRDPSPCATTGYVSAAVFTNILGDFGADLFDGEVRKTAYETDWSIGIPPGLTIDSARVRFTGAYNRYVTPYLPINPVSVTATTANFNLKPFYKTFGGTIESWEDRNSVEVRVYYHGANPACVNVSSTQKFTSNREFLNPIKAFIPTETTDVNYTFDNATAGSTGFYMISNNDLTAVGDTVTWLVRLANTSAGTLNNVWLAKKSGISGVNIASIRKLNCGTPTPIGAPIPIDAKGYYPIGNVNNSGVCLEIKATFTNCVKDSLTLISGFSCTGYPSSIQNLNLLCGIAEQKVFVRPAPTQLQQIITAQPSVTVDLCEIMKYKIAVNSSQKGSVSSIQTQMEILPGQGLTIKTGTSQVEYPHNSGNWLTIPDPVLLGNTYQWNISQAPALAATIGAHGLYGIDSALVNKNRFNLRFDVTTTPCNFRSGIVFVFKTQGKRACGEVIRATDQVTLPVNINGAPTTLNNYAVDITTGKASPCSNLAANFHFKAINQGPGVSSANEYIDFVIFNGGLLGSIVNVHNANLGTPTIYTPAGGTNLTYAMPVGVAIGDSIVFDAIVALNTSGLICGVNQVRVDASTTVRFSATCAGTGQTCTLQQTTGSDADYVQISRPKIKIQTLVASATLNPPSGETLTANVIVKNEGTENILSSNPFTIKFYHDADLSGSVTAGDLLLGSKTTAANIAPGATYTVNFVQDVAAGKACPILAIIDETPCYCSNTAVATVSVPLTPSVFETTTCKGITSIPLGLNEVAGYDYQWVALTPGALQYLSSTTTANPTFTKFTGYSEDFQYVVYVNRGASSCMGEIHVTVHLASDTDCPQYEGSIGNYAWIDTDGNGLQNEPAAQGLNGVTVELWHSTDNVVGGVDDSFVTAQTTANGTNGRPGYYLFQHLNNGNYYIKFQKNIAGTVGFTTQNATANTDNNSDADANGVSPIVTINIQTGGVAKDNLTIDAGYNPEATLGDYTWIDANRDGKQDATESPLPGVKVRLYRADAIGTGRALIDSTATNAFGYYLFTKLNAGEYYVEFVKPSNYTTSPQILNTIDGSDPDSTGFTQKTSLTRGQNKLDIDAGFFVTPLPVQLISFDGLVANCNIDLTWITATELNNKEFVILRSNDGINDWKELGRVQGAGTTNTTHTYHFIDKKPRRNNFYKLVQYDFDGRSETYNLTRNVSTDGCYETLDNGVSSIYPNPATGSQVNFKFYTIFGSEEVKIEFTNALGQTVLVINKSITDDVNVVNLDIANLPVGAYSVRVLGNGWYSDTQKFIRTN